MGCVVALSTFTSPCAGSAQPVPSPSAPNLPFPSAAASVVPAVARPAGPLPVDGAYSLPGGIWNCETLGNTPATSVYKLANARTMVERTTLHLANRQPVELDTTFVYNPQHRSWKLSMQGGAYIASAPGWSQSTWIFQGEEADESPHRSVRLVYTSLGPDAYRSDYQALNQSSWKTFSGATCKREIP
jgi:hypothetical protein